MTLFASSTPLLLQPIYVPRAWGGLSLLRDLHPDAPEGAGIGESWDIASYPTADCRMPTGPMAGEPLSRLLRCAGEAVLGRPGRTFDDFALLHKFLAPLRDLPLQVHPDDEYELRVEGQNGKAECWVIVDCGAQATIFLGLEHVRDRAQLVASGELVRRARRVPVRTGDVVEIPTGIVHGLGANILAYEVQQNSDVTYRLDDFGRGIDGPQAHREHLRKALDVIDLPANLSAKGPTANWSAGDGFLDCAPKFGLGCIRTSADLPSKLPHDGRCRGLTVVAGTGNLESSAGVFPLHPGQSWLLPDPRWRRACAARAVCRAGWASSGAGRWTFRSSM